MTYIPQQPAEKTAFVTTALLASAATYTSSVIDLDGYSQVQTEVLASHDGTLDLTFYEDSGGTNIVRSLSIPYFATNGYQLFAAPAFANYVKYEFTNDGGVIQTDFYFTTKILTTAISPQLLGVEAFISPSMISTLNRSVIVGKTPDGGYNNVGITPLDNIKVALSEPLTAFGDLRTAELTPQFQNSFEYTVDNTELTTNTEVGAATVTQATAMAVLTTSTTTGSSAELISKPHAKYRAGFGGNTRFTARFTTGTAGTTQLIGLADETGSSEAYKNGFMVGYLGTVFGFHRFVNDTVTTVALTAADDPLDGTGRSGMTVDLTKINVFQIEFQYLGAGQIVVSIEDDKTGLFVPFHKVLYANNNNEPSVYNPNFHFTMFADNGATTDNIVLRSASYAYFIEGITKYFEVHQPEFSSDKRQKTSVTTEVAILTIRNKATYASKTNFIDLVLENIGVSIEAGAANNLGEIRLVRNATLGGSPSYTDINTSDSIVDIDVAGTTVTNGKTLLVIPLAGKNDKEVIDLSGYDIILQPGETLTISGESVASATINGTLLWKELF